MKKIKLDGKLNLNKTTISELNQNQMVGVKGGAIESILLLACDDGGDGKSNNLGCKTTDIFTDGVKELTKTFDTIANC